MERYSSEDTDNRLEEAARKREEAFEKALNLLEQNPDFPAVQVRIHDRQKKVEAGASEASRERSSNARLQYCFELLNITAEEFLALVVDIESHAAFTTVMANFTSRAFVHFSGIPIDSIPATHPFAPRPLPPLIEDRDKFSDKLRDFIADGYRRLASLKEPKSESGNRVRRGFRREIQNWIKAKGLANLEQTARKLGVSRSVLKSIMSDKGKPRYGPDTLERVLKEIGYVEPGE
jgi:mRNA-degrading endonuclease RelE of RelBE toxin-antitoxin system